MSSYFWVKLYNFRYFADVFWLRYSISKQSFRSYIDRKNSRSFH